MYICSKRHFWKLVFGLVPPYTLAACTCIYIMGTLSPFRHNLVNTCKYITTMNRPSLHLLVNLFRQCGLFIRYTKCSPRALQVNFQFKIVMYFVYDRRRGMMEANVIPPYVLYFWVMNVTHTNHPMAHLAAYTYCTCFLDS